MARRRCQNNPLRERPDVRELIDEYLETCGHSSEADVLAATRKALGHRHYLLVAKAAELAGDRLLYDCESDLAAAYARFLDDPIKRDPHCTAKGAIARALVALDYPNADFYLAGIRYRQHEPVWGGTEDRAVDLRSTCAAGLAATSYPRALIALVGLLHDPEPHARSGAIRAIACAEPVAAEAVLRSKALTGDQEPEVIGDCFAALLRVSPEEAPSFVAGFLADDDPQRSGLAALALGESGLEAALTLLRCRWDDQPFKRDEDRLLLRAAVLHRSDAAFDWLIEVVERGDRTSAELVLTELAAYRSNRRLRERLRTAVAGRDDPLLSAGFENSL
jgi:hypothetical protein